MLESGQHKLREIEGSRMAQALGVAGPAAGRSAVLPEGCVLDLVDQSLMRTPEAPSPRSPTHSNQTLRSTTSPCAADNSPRRVMAKRRLFAGQPAVTEETALAADADAVGCHSDRLRRRVDADHSSDDTRETLSGNRSAHTLLGVPGPDGGVRSSRGGSPGDARTAADLTSPNRLGLHDLVDDMARLATSPWSTASAHSTDHVAGWTDSDDDEPTLETGEKAVCCNCNRELPVSTEIYTCRDGRRRYFCTSCPSPARPKAKRRHGSRHTSVSPREGVPLQSREPCQIPL